MLYIGGCVFHCDAIIIFLADFFNCWFQVEKRTDKGIQFYQAH
jgi:hypothetical protein